MWTPENITALVTGIIGVLGAVTVLVRQVQHANDPAAHNGAGHPTAGPSAASPDG